MILSFHPIIPGDKNIICAGRDPGEAELTAIKAARAVILPQGCRESLYRMAKENTRHIFPDYDTRFRYPGKIGQAEMFRAFSATFPSTLAFPSVRAWKDRGGQPVFGFPLVVKSDWGGEGSGVRLIRDQTGLDDAINKVLAAENGGDFGFLLQEYVPCSSRSLRVVVIHRALVSYWRVGRPGEPLMGGLSQGADIDFHKDPLLVAIAEGLVRDFCGKTGINLAGFDLIFPENGGGPLFLEVNWFFGRRGLGGSTGYYKILEKNVRAWIRETLG